MKLHTLLPFGLLTLVVLGGCAVQPVYVPPPSPVVVDPGPVVVDPGPVVVDPGLITEVTIDPLETS